MDRSFSLGNSLALLQKRNAQAAADGDDGARVEDDELAELGVQVAFAVPHDLSLAHSVKILA